MLAKVNIKKKMKKQNMKKQLEKVSLLIAILIIADQLSKVIMINLNREIIISSGLKLSVGQIGRQTDNLKYILISVIIIGIILRYITRENYYIKFNSRIALGLALAGAISNLIDRIVWGMTISFIRAKYFISLNLAYIYIIIAWIGIAVILTRNSIKIKQEKKVKKGIKDENKNTK